MKNIIIKLKDKADIEDLLENINPASAYDAGSSFFDIVAEPLHDFDNDAIAFDSASDDKTEFSDPLDRTYLLKINDSGNDSIYQNIKDKLSENELIEDIEEDEENSFGPIDHNQRLISEIEPNQSNPPPVEDATQPRWNLDIIECEKAWTVSTGKEITIAVIDSGIDSNHPDFADRLWNDSKGNIGYNYIDNSYFPIDENGHGSHVSGILASNNLSYLYAKGVAPQAKIMTVKCLSKNGRGMASDLSKGILFAVKNGAKVINNSWGPGRHFAIRDAVKYAVQSNCIVVFAAGNSCCEVGADFAAAQDSVICVAATNEQDQIAYFSNYGEHVTLSAPGVEIMSSKMGDKKWAKMDGTSMAAPHVSGLIALLMSLDSNLTRIKIVDILTASAVDVSSEKKIGRGRIYCFEAIKLFQKNN